MRQDGWFAGRPLRVLEERNTGASSSRHGRGLSCRFRRGREPADDLTAASATVTVGPLLGHADRALTVRDPVVAAITGMCQRYQMGCLDMYSIPFEPGMVRDDMHLAELGWAMADQGIAEYFSR